MGMQINIGDHISSNSGYIAFPYSRQADVRWARTRARQIAYGLPSANAYFRRLPLGRSLGDLLNDSSIWINFHPSMPYFGETNMVGGKEIAISAMACRIGRWTVLATMIHELAHANGAPGGDDRKAEEALLSCGLGKLSEHASGVDDPWTPYNPNIHG